MVRFTLRLPDNLHKQLVNEAQQQERSLNAHLVYLLKVRHDHKPMSDGGLPVELPSLEGTLKQEARN